MLLEKFIRFKKNSIYL